MHLTLAIAVREGGQSGRLIPISATSDRDLLVGTSRRLIALQRERVRMVTDPQLKDVAHFEQARVENTLRKLLPELGDAA